MDDSAPVTLGLSKNFDAANVTYKILSERCFVLEVDALTCDGVGELEVVGMEVETVGTSAVEGITEDGSVETFLVGTMHA